tara:strand:- start:215 stop:358 length:144 start_codon:yes stop_codon:yes gene_type:complete
MYFGDLAGEQFAYELRQMQPELQAPLLLLVQQLVPALAVFLRLPLIP